MDLFNFYSVVCVFWNKKPDLTTLYSQVKTLLAPSLESVLILGVGIDGCVGTIRYWLMSYEHSPRNCQSFCSIYSCTQTAKVRFRYLRENEKYMLAFASLVHPKTLNILPFRLV